MAEQLTSFFVKGVSGSLTLLMAKDLATALDQVAFLYKSTTRTSITVVEKRYELVESIDHQVDFTQGTST